MAGTIQSIKIVNTLRPPNISVSIPRGSLDNEPVRIGVAISTPNWVSVNPRSCFIWIPKIENNVHTAKLPANATVFAESTDHCFWLCVVKRRVENMVGSQTR